MIERTVLLALKPEFVGDVAAICAHAEATLAEVPRVRQVVALPAADARTAERWDIHIRLHFASLDDVAAYLPDPAHRALVDGYLLPRVARLEAFNMAGGPER